MAKRALIVGINYPGTTHELRGCVNDALEMEKMLRASFGFNDIRMLLDNAATTANILSELERLVTEPEPGDVLFFHYSGHGSQFPDNYDDDHEPDGLDEIICPIDLNWHDKMIRDDDLKRIFDTVPAGVNLTVVLDCCNSGGGLDQLNQYQPLGDAAQPAYTDPVKGGRFLTPPESAIALTESRHLAFKPRTLTHREVNKTGLLISGCQSHQTSADAFISGKYMGACTYMVIDTLKKYGHDCDYRKLVEEINHKMVEYGFSQRPELNGSASLFNHKFLAPMGKAEETPSDNQEDDLTSLSDQDQNVGDANVQDQNAHAQGDGSSGTGVAGSGDAIIVEHSETGSEGYYSGSKDDDKKKYLIALAILALAAIGAYLFY